MIQESFSHSLELDRAELLHREGQTEVALSIAQRVADDAKAIGNAREECRASLICATVLQSLSDFPGAAQLYRRVITLAQTLSDDDLCLNACRQLCKVYMLTSEYELALDCLTQATMLSQVQNDRKLSAEIASDMGAVYWNMSDYQGAIEQYSRAIELFQACGDVRSEMRTHGRLGLVYVDLGDLNKALEYMETDVADLREEDDAFNAAVSLSNIADVHRQLGNADKAYDFLMLAFGIAERNDFDAVTASIHGNLGTLYTDTREFSKAREEFQRAYDLHCAVSNTSAAAINLGYLGRLYANPEYDGHDMRKAKEYLLQAIELQNKGGRKNYLFGYHSLISDIFESEGNATEALAHFRKFHSIREEVLNDDAKKKALVMAHNIQLAEARTKVEATQTVLYKVLPTSIADRLIEGNTVADYFSNVSILFADIVGFTTIASTMSANHVIEFLNHVFAECDRIMDRFGCEKIKTIGDGYMAVCGAPLEMEDHAQRMARAAMELNKALLLPPDILALLPPRTQLQFRIGLHCGPVVAGIVGEKRFVYDVYSDAVNTAARMESHGQPGRIHCSHDFKMHLQKQDSGFVFEEREEIEIKGKGMMRTYFLVQNAEFRV